MPIWLTGCMSDVQACIDVRLTSALAATSSAQLTDQVDMKEQDVLYKPSSLHQERALSHACRTICHFGGTSCSGDCSRRRKSRHDDQSDALGQMTSSSLLTYCTDAPSADVCSAVKGTANSCMDHSCMHQMEMIDGMASKSTSHMG